MYGGWAYRLAGTVDASAGSSGKRTDAISERGGWLRCYAALTETSFRRVVEFFVFDDGERGGGVRVGEREMGWRSSV